MPSDLDFWPTYWPTQMNLQDLLAHLLIKENNCTKSFWQSIHKYRSYDTDKSGCLHIHESVVTTMTRLLQASSTICVHINPSSPKNILKAMGNKRAMMALDRSPESFSPQINSTSLFLWFQLVTHGVGPVLIPRGIMWIQLTKIYKEMLHTENLSSISSSFREEEFWSWSSLFLCSNLWPQGWDQFWPQRNHMNKVDQSPQRDAKYQISKL